MTLDKKKESSNKNFYEHKLHPAKLYRSIYILIFDRPLKAHSDQMPISMSGFKSIRNLFNKIQKHQKPIYRAKSLGHGSSRPLWVFCILARGQDGTKDFLWILGRAGKWLNSCQNCCCTKYTSIRLWICLFPLWYK